MAELKGSAVAFISPPDADTLQTQLRRQHWAHPLHLKGRFCEKKMHQSITESLV